MTATYTQNQWYAKLQSFVPMQYTVDEGIFTAVFYALAKAFSAQGTVADEMVRDTFILLSRDGTLDTHGGERSIDRIVTLFRELDPAYRIRVQNFFSQPNKFAIKSVIDKILIRGVSQIREDFEAAFFFDRETFFNRGAILLDPAIINTFTIVVDRQVHTPYSFLNREYFSNRGDFVGRNDSSEEVFNLILQIVNNTAALGTLYRIVERLE